MRNEAGIDWESNQQCNDIGHMCIKRYYISYVYIYMIYDMILYIYIIYILIFGIMYYILYIIYVYLHIGIAERGCCEPRFFEGCLTLCPNI